MNNNNIAKWIIKKGDVNMLDTSSVPEKYSGMLSFMEDYQRTIVDVENNRVIHQRKNRKNEWYGRWNIHADVLIHGCTKDENILHFLAKAHYGLC